MGRVSIIIPTHNRSEMLGRAIQSAKLAGQDVEVVVVDDASTDETSSICSGLDGIVFVRLDHNVGLPQARNIGIANSSGEFIAFLDDDDLRIAGSIDKQVDVLAQDPSLGFVYGQVQIGDSKNCVPIGEIRPACCPVGDLFWEFLKGNFIYVPSVLVRRRHLETVGLFDPKLRATEDWDLWIRLSEAYPVGTFAEPVAIYREPTRGAPQMSADRPRMCRWTAYTLAKALNTPRAREAGPKKRRQIWLGTMDFLWRDLMDEGRYALSKGRFSYAARNYLTAIRLNPARAWRLRTLASIVRDWVKIRPQKSVWSS